MVGKDPPKGKRKKDEMFLPVPALPLPTPEHPALLELSHGR